MVSAMALTNQQIDAAGERLRDAEQPAADDLAIYAEYRESFRDPVASVMEMALELTLDTELLDWGSRPKTVESVVAKLQAQDIALTEMTDIGGVRIVLPSLVEVDRVHGQIDEGLIAQVKDYRGAGTKRGYRTLHLILRAAPDRVVELQIRSQIHNVWANLSERLQQRTGYDIKHAAGPAALLDALEELSEYGRAVDGMRRDVVGFGRWPWQRMEQAEIGAVSLEPVANRRAAMLRTVLDQRTARWETLYDELQQFRQGVELLSGWED